MYIGIWFIEKIFSYKPWESVREFMIHLHKKNFEYPFIMKEGYVSYIICLQVTILLLIA